ncbi:hypothetical protein J6590_076013 [Homalodisca vitripennis]|nr:hypothetical protein J6590_076013 [Homalodisca vitripennis]
MSHRKCFQDAAHNTTLPPLPPITTHSRSHAQLKSVNCTCCHFVVDLKELIYRNIFYLNTIARQLNKSVNIPVLTSLVTGNTERWSLRENPTFLEKTLLSPAHPLDSRLARACKSLGPCNFCKKRLNGLQGCTIWLYPHAASRIPS